MKEIILIENKWEEFEEPLKDEPTELTLDGDKISIKLNMEFYALTEDGNKDAQMLKDQFYSKRQHITSITPYIELLEIQYEDDSKKYKYNYFITLGQGMGGFNIGLPNKKRYKEVSEKLINWYYGE